MEFTEICKPFASLTAAELYDILNLRNEIFVVEQQCLYLDTDGKDQRAQHLMLYAAGRLAAYARILPAGLSYTEPSIGRIVSSSAVRGKGYGKQLVRLAIANCIRINGKTAVRISAQAYLVKFYAAFGFAVCGEVYLEDGIPHIEMLRPAGA